MTKLIQKSYELSYGGIKLNVQNLQITPDHLVVYNPRFSEALNKLEAGTPPGFDEQQPKFRINTEKRTRKRISDFFSC